VHQKQACTWASLPPVTESSKESQRKNINAAESFGQHLRALRKQRGWSQQKLATESLLDRTTISRTELAAFSPTLDILISISRALGMEVEDLFKDTQLARKDSPS
jgi:DNA-binding XRE family transcriptional regulator